MTDLPAFITFTGADVRTDLAALGRLAAQYPVEIAFLFSPIRQGAENRYPPLDAIDVSINALKEAGCTRFSAHLCGGHSRVLMDHKALPDHVDALICEHFHRVQVNGAPAHFARHLAAWGHERCAEVILQCPREFPSEAATSGCSWLLDGSGGRGISPTSWPRGPAGMRSGFAGGLNPDNVAGAVQAIGAQTARYWIDMETGVRDADDWFSVAKCRQVCEAVYGKREGSGS